jgi:transcriptional regulator with XRE-family HTH domain
MTNISGRALKEERKRKGWSQNELSEATRPRVDVSTISRIERGQPTRTRTNTLSALANALGVKPDVLCTRIEMDRDVMKLRIETAARNALALVARRYGVSRENIVGVAPLLFFIVAEQSLRQRREDIVALRASTDALRDLQREFPHLPLTSPVEEEAFTREEKSIEVRDLFGRKVFDGARPSEVYAYLDYDEESENPFINFLRRNLAAISSSEVVESVQWAAGFSPRYEICADEAVEIFGGDKEAARVILCGAVALHEMPKASPEDRASWARVEYDRKYGLAAMFDDAVGLPNGSDRSLGSGDMP